MDFEELLSVANNNELDAKYNASKISYSTEFAPSKKQAKNSVQSVQIRNFLAKRIEEEKRKAEAEEIKKKNLLALRALNTKSNKKAKLMTSRTKDNDFSKIKLSEEELEAKKKREREIQALELKNKRERMIARIELEEKEKLLPHKRKRKHKQVAEQNGQGDNDVPVTNNNEINDRLQDVSSTSKLHKFSKMEAKQQKKTFKRPAPPPVDFHDLLKVASQKQFEPVKLKTVEVESRPLTKKEKKAQEEEEARVRRRMEAQANARNGSPYSYNSNNVSSKSKSNPQNTVNTNSGNPINANSNSIKMKSEKTNHFSSGKNPSVTSQQKADNVRDKSKTLPVKKIDNENCRIKHESQMKLSSKSIPSTNNYPPKHMSNSTKKVIPGIKTKVGSSLPQVSPRNTPKKYIDDPDFLQQQRTSAKGTIQKEPNDIKLNPKVVNKNSTSNEKVLVKQGSQSNNSNISFSDDQISQIENRLRQKMEKEMKERIEKIAMQMADKMLNKNSHNTNRTDVSATKKVPPKPISSKLSEQNAIRHKNLSSNKPISHSMKRELSPKKPLPKAFHTNPYLLPPRRILESQRPSKPTSRRIESDDDDDDDDEMDDFIDNDPLTENEDYSKYIREIFNYDRSRFVDEDDEDIPEASFSQVIQEENKSARAGFLEDKQEEIKQEAERKRKLMKKKKR